MSIITQETLIPDLLREHPRARTVLDNYGLKGCGGPEGPHETIGYFARAHEVNLDNLLQQISQTIDLENIPVANTAEQISQPSVADTIYRRFFMAGILVILTFGATWGAHLLWKIGLGGSFGSISGLHVNAHAQAQVFGWMGLFILGFAYQAFPRFWHTELARPHLAVVSFWLMMAGVTLSCVGVAFMPSTSLGLLTATSGAVSEAAAVVLFAWQLLLTSASARQEQKPYVAFIFAGAIWFLVSSFLNLIHVMMVKVGISGSEVTTLQWILRDMQFHGLGLTMILGVALRTVPHFWGVAQISSRRAYLSLLSISSAVIIEVAIVWHCLRNHIGGMELALTVPAALLLVASALVVAPWKLWRPLPDSDRSTKFVRAAYLWLFVSLLMLLASPLYSSLSHVAVSHAYFGAIRHAITVGFISLMIMGYAGKVVPTLNGVNIKTSSQLWIPFLLVNTGCFLRVVTQVLSDFSSTSFAVVGISGTLEVLGLALWGFDLARTMLRGRSAIQSTESISSPKPERIEGEHMVGDVVEWYPETLPIFLKHGFTAVARPMMRKTVAKHVSIKQACSMHGVQPEDFVLELNRTVQDKESSCSGCVCPGAGNCAS